MKHLKNVLLMVFSIVFLLTVSLSGEDGQKAITTIMTGTTVNAIITIAGPVPVSGAADTAPIVMQVQGYAKCPSGRKIQMDKAIIVGYAEGSSVGSYVKIYVTSITYYDYENVPRYSDIEGFVSQNGSGGVIGKSILSKEGENTAKIMLASLMGSLEKILIAQAQVMKPDTAGTVVNQVGASGFDKLAEIYQKLSMENMDQIFVANGQTVQVTFMKPFEYYTKEFIEGE